MKEARVDADSRTVEVIYHKDKLDRQKVIDHIKELGLKGDIKLIVRAIRHLFHRKTKSVSDS